jgi:nicotinamidase-related amidase
MTALLTLLAPALLSGPAPEPAPLVLNLRKQIARPDGTLESSLKTVEWAPEKTAVVLCDLWDRHWCAGATGRVGEMAPRVNEFLKAARSKGALIIHAPSDTMTFYADTPQRKLAQSAPAADAVVPLKGWCGLDKDHEGPLPIDDSDGGCDDSPQCQQGRAWTRQHPAVEIAPEDAITDSAEAYNLMKQRGIENVIVLGVHTNMCVLGRPFSIRQMVYQGMNVALVRDLTDTMYNPRMAPKVNHFDGTRLVVSHIERHWCPTFASSDLLGGSPFRFAADPTPEP